MKVLEVGFDHFANFLESSCFYCIIRVYFIRINLNPQRPFGCLAQSDVTVIPSWSLNSSYHLLLPLWSKQLLTNCLQHQSTAISMQFLRPHLSRQFDGNFHIFIVDTVAVISCLLLVSLIDIPNKLKGQWRHLSTDLRFWLRIPQPTRISNPATTNNQKFFIFYPYSSFAPLRSELFIYSIWCGFNKSLCCWFEMLLTRPLFVSTGWNHKLMTVWYSFSL